jgi:hypothetical protein
LAVGSSFASSPQIQQNDSLLFFFAGHGGTLPDRSNPTRKFGFIVPDDAKREFGRYDVETVLPLDELARRMQRSCPCMHKFVVIDSCHSGAIMDETFAQGIAAANKLGVSELLASRPSFTVLASSLEDEAALDELTSMPHSPFFLALRDTLTNDFSGQPFSGSLFAETVTGTMRDRRISDGFIQTASWGRLKSLEPSGEFYFVPQRSLSDWQLELQAFPGVDGEWWGKGFPWLLPDARYALSHELGLAQTPEFLRQQQQQRVRSFLTAVASSSPTLPIHCRRVLTGQAKIEQLTPEEVVLLDSTAESKAVRMHTLASIEFAKSQIQGDIQVMKAASLLYNDALNLYRNLESGRAEGLELLCHADYLMCRLEAAKLEGSPENLSGMYAEGLSLARGKNIPALLQVHSIVVAGECSRMQKELTQTSQTFSIGVEHVERCQWFNASDLSAYVFERAAWAAIDRFDATTAKAMFEVAYRKRKGQLHDNDTLAAMKLLHLDHGMANVDLLQLDFTRALLGFSGVYDSSFNLEAIAESDFRDRLLQRRANALERRADTRLICFGGSPPKSEAALILKDYQTALEIQGGESSIYPRIKRKAAIFSASLTSSESDAETTQVHATSYREDTICSLTEALLEMNREGADGNALELATQASIGRDGTLIPIAIPYVSNFIKILAKRGDLRGVKTLLNLGWSVDPKRSETFLVFLWDRDNTTVIYINGSDMKIHPLHFRLEEVSNAFSKECMLDAEVVAWIAEIGSKQDSAIYFSTDRRVTISPLSWPKRWGEFPIDRIY